MRTLERGWLAPDSGRYLGEGEGGRVGDYSRKFYTKWLRPGVRTLTLSSVPFLQMVAVSLTYRRKTASLLVGSVQDNVTGPFKYLNDGFLYPF